MLCPVCSKKKTLRRLTAVMLRTFPKMVDVAGVFFTALVVCVACVPVWLEQR